MTPKICGKEEALFPSKVDYVLIEVKQPKLAIPYDDERIITETLKTIEGHPQSSY